MKILVMSDSHGRRDLVKKCIEQHPDVQAVFHLGDLASDVREMEKKTVIQEDTCIPVFTAALFITARTGKEPKSPTTE